MLSDKEIVKIEKIIGYTFRRKELLRAAFCHISFANEHGVESNERMEFLGDAVLNFVVADILYDRELGDEGRMSVTRAEIVSRNPLAAEVTRLGILKFLKVGNGFSVEKHMSPKFISNLYEAVAAAIYKDSDIFAVKDFIKRTLLKHLKLSKAHDFKTTLQEAAQARGKKVVYEDVVTEGVPPIFTSRALIGGVVLGEGSGTRKKLAQQAAACEALGNLVKTKKSKTKE